MSMIRTIARRLQREKFGTNHKRKRRVAKSFTVAPEPAPEARPEIAVAPELPEVVHESM